MPSIFGSLKACVMGCSKGTHRLRFSHGSSLGRPPFPAPRGQTCEGGVKWLLCVHQLNNYSEREKRCITFEMREECFSVVIVPRVSPPRGGAGTCFPLPPAGWRDLYVKNSEGNTCAPGHRATPAWEIERWRRDAWLKHPSGSDILSLRAGSRWELLGTRCASGRVFDLPNRSPGGEKRPQRKRSDLQGLGMELQITKSQPEKAFSQESKEQQVSALPCWNFQRPFKVPGVISFEYLLSPASSDASPGPPSPGKPHLSLSRVFFLQFGSRQRPQLAIGGPPR